MNRPPLLALVGPTASGKTDASIALAEALTAEVLCADSMLVYRGMDEGTAKPTADQRERVAHHLLDLAEPTQPFSVARFQQLARQAVAQCRARGHQVLVVAGGGLYYRAVVDDLTFPGTGPGTRAVLEAEAALLGPEALYRRLARFDPEAASRIEPRNGRRTVRALEVAALTGRPFSEHARSWNHYPAHTVRAAGIDMDRAWLYRRIEQRVEAMMPRLLAETRALLDRGSGPFLTSLQAIGYAEAISCLQGGMSEAEAAAVIVRRTKGLARRQMAWLRRDPRIRWYPAGEDGAAGIVQDVLDHLRGSKPRTVGRRLAGAVLGEA
jgi:tRNA dimethylallyltransferase